MFTYIKTKDKLWSLSAVLLGLSFVVFFAISRNYFTFETETDYLGGFIVEAQRVLNNEPLQLDFHPPFYPIILAITQIFFKDWFTTGLIISCISSFIVLSTGFLFFYKLIGKSAAWGCLLGLLTSSVFVSFSALATSDVFFLALYSSCILFFFFAFETNSNKLWALAGLLLSLCLLTRSNSLTLLVFLVLPLLQKTSFKIRLKKFLCTFCSMMTVLSLWLVFSKYTGSQFIPKGNHLNLALTYFSETDDRLSGDARFLVENKFENIFDVIFFDPAHIAVVYSKDFFKMVMKNFWLIAFPLNLFVLPGLFLLLFHKRGETKFIYIYLIATFLQIALVNLKYYENRYYLFLVPIFGACVGICINRLLEMKSKPFLRYPTYILFSIIFIIGIYYSYNKVYSTLHLNDKELSEAIPKIKSFLAGSKIIARKPHISFYTNSQRLGFPSVKSYAELSYKLKSNCNGKPVYLYYGAAEKYYRPQFGELIFARQIPKWLEPIVQSEKDGDWVLYRFECEIPNS